MVDNTYALLSHDGDSELLGSSIEEMTEDSSDKISPNSKNVSDNMKSKDKSKSGSSQLSRVETDPTILDLKKVEIAFDKQYEEMFNASYDELIDNAEYEEISNQKLNEIDRYFTKKMNEFTVKVKDLCDYPDIVHTQNVYFPYFLNNVQSCLFDPAWVSLVLQPVPAIL